MNKDNLLRMANLIANLPNDVFTMSTFNCGSGGCVIGHCVALDMENIEKNFMGIFGRIAYVQWSEYFTDLNHYSPEWRYLFSSSWGDIDNTRTGAAKRIRYVVKNGVPKRWKEEMIGNAPLSYTKNRNMRKKNLRRMADYIETIPQEKFRMSVFRISHNFEKTESPICDTVGCIIGHCTALDMDNVRERFTNGMLIDFGKWSEEFTGLKYDEEEYIYLFSQSWEVNGSDNTPTGAAKRIRHFVEHGLPDDWKEQIEKKAPLSYE